MLRAEFRIPSGWVSRGSLATDFESAVGGLALDADALEVLRLALAKVAKFLDGLPADRDSWVLPNRSGQIDAVLTLRGWPTDLDGRARLLRLLAESGQPDSQVDVINRTIREVDLPCGPAVEMHDFSVGHGFDEGTRPASERAVITIFPPPGIWALDLLLVTQDLLLFEDSLDYLHTIAETILPLTEAVE